jgi:voltage-gated potassium channel
MLLTQFQTRLQEVFYRDRANDRLRIAIDSFIMILVAVNLIAIIAESIAPIHQAYASYFHQLEVFSVIVFTLEYMLRIWASPSGKKSAYIFSFHGIVDFVATVPFYLQVLFPGLDLRFLRVLRMLRILKFSHYNTALEDLSHAIYYERDTFISAMYIFFIGLLMTSTTMYFVEHNVQPDKFGSIPDAMWWSIITLTTVGYGDVSPVTAIGKIIGAITALMGVCSVALLTGIIANAFAKLVDRRKSEFEAAVADAIADGVLTVEEHDELERLRLRYGITPEQAESVFQIKELEFEKKHK